MKYKRRTIHVVKVGMVAEYIADKGYQHLNPQFVLETLRDRKYYKKATLEDAIENYRRLNDKPQTIDIRTIEQNVNVEPITKRRKRKLSAKERKVYALTENTTDYIAYALGRGEDEGQWRGGAAYQTISVKDGEMSLVKAKFFRNASTNKLEIRAIMSAVNSVPEKKKVIVYTHNEYAAHILMGEWKAKRHLDLIEAYRDIAERRNVLVLWRPYNKTPLFAALDDSIRKLPELDGVQLTNRLNELDSKRKSNDNIF